MEARQLKLDTKLVEVDVRILGLSEAQSNVSSRLAALERDQRAVAEAAQRSLKTALAAQREQQQCATHLDEIHGEWTLQQLASGGKMTKLGNSVQDLSATLAKVEADLQHIYSEGKLLELGDCVQALDARVAKTELKLGEQEVWSSKLAAVDAHAAALPKAWEAQSKELDRRMVEQERNLKRLSQAVTTLASDRPKISLQAAEVPWKAQVEEQAWQLQRLTETVASLEGAAEVRVTAMTAEWSQHLEQQADMMAALSSGVASLLEEPAASQNSWELAASSLLHVFSRRALKGVQGPDEIRRPAAHLVGSPAAGCTGSTSCAHEKDPDHGTSMSDAGSQASVGEAQMSAVSPAWSQFKESLAAQLSSGLADVCQRMDTLQDSVTECGGRCGHFSGELQAVSSRVDRFADQVQESLTKHEVHEERLGAIGTDIQTQEQRLQSLADGVEKVLLAGAHSRQVAEVLAAVHDRVDKQAKLLQELLSSSMASTLQPSRFLLSPSANDEG